MTTVGMTKTTAAATKRSDDGGAVVLTYELSETHLTASLVDVADGSQRGESRTMDLDDLTPEQIGLTVPMVWELLDRAKVTPESVVILGDVSTATVSPILELALGVPVIAPERPRSPAANQQVAKSTPPAVTRPVPAKRVPRKQIATSASVVAAEEVASPVEVDDPPTQEIAVIPPVVLAAYTAAEVVSVTPPTQPESSETPVEGKGRRGLVIAAAVAAVLLAGGIGAGLSLMGNDDVVANTPEQTPAAVTEQATEPAAEPPSAAPSAQLPAPAAVPPAIAPAAPAAPPPAPADVPAAPVYTSNSANTAPPAWTPNRAPSSSAASAPVAPAPQSSPSYIPPPAFTVPVPVPDPNNPNATPQQLQDEAWARHWEQTREYFEQQGG